MEEYGKTRDLYERLLKRTQYVKVVFFNSFSLNSISAILLNLLFKNRYFHYVFLFKYDCFQCPAKMYGVVNFIMILINREHVEANLQPCFLVFAYLKVLVSVCDSPEMFFSKVWISFAQFEASTATDESIIKARYVKWLSYILDRDRDHSSSSEWKTYSHATPDEPLRRAQSGQLNEIIYLSCRKGFMAEHLS